MLDPTLYDKLTSFCAYTERCTTDIKTKCSKLAIPKEEVLDYVSKLEEDGFLNDERYVALFVKSKTNRNWGPHKIVASLKRKRLAHELIKKHTTGLDEENQLEKVIDLAEKKWPKIKAKDKHDHKQKMIKFLMSKGFGYAVIKEALALATLEDKD